MLPRSRLGFLVLAVHLLAGAPSAQQSGVAVQPGTGRISLDVVVTAKSGPPVAGLQQQDFTLLDNKHPQTITSFKAVAGRGAPIAVIVGMDAAPPPAHKVGSE